MELTGIRQCPFCELRFPNRNVLEAHLREDHPHRVAVDGHLEADAATSLRPAHGRDHPWS